MGDDEKPPASGPTGQSVAAQAEWRQLTSQSLKDVRASAGKWRDGLAALITLLTAGLVVSGPNQAQTMPTGWRSAVALLLIGGMLAVLVGLLKALAVAAGKPRRLTYEAFVAQGGSADAIEIAEALEGGKELRIARFWAVPGIVAVLAALGLWIVSPGQDQPKLQVTTRNEVLCGTLIGARSGMLVLELDGEKVPVSIPPARVLGASVVNKCDAARTLR